MQIDGILQSFVRDSLEGIVVMDDSGNICYSDVSVEVTDSMQRQIRKRFDHWSRQGSSNAWELTDSEDGKYYKVLSNVVERDGKSYFCSHLTDVSDYAHLYQEIASYSRHMSDISDFQGSMLAKISASCELCLPELKYFCNSDEAVMYLETMDKNAVMRLSFSSEMKKEMLPPSVETLRYLGADRFQCVGGYHCLLREETADNRRYAVFLKGGDSFNDEYFRGNSLYNVIRLFVENGILREKIVYESEHDNLTGLYNKGKYLSMVRNAFSHPVSLAVYILDVNNLKYVNDNFGHEAGDDLIRSAARSIKAVTDDDRVVGFRMGGDEFAMIAVGVTESEAEELRERWKDSLDSINQSEHSDIVVACGMAFGEGNYDLETLIDKADSQMYSNKKRLKAEAAAKENASASLI